MHFALSPEQSAFADTIRRFARAELADGALQRAHSAAFPWDVARRLAEMGLLGITVREEDGGIGGTLMDAVTAIQELALVCPKSADVVQGREFRPRCAPLRNMPVPPRKSASSRTCWRAATSSRWA